MSELLDEINAIRAERAKNEKYVVILCACGSIIPSEEFNIKEATDLLNFYTSLGGTATLTQARNAGQVIKAWYIANHLALTPECNKYYKGEER